jgi:hypothetical protein
VWLCAKNADKTIVAFVNEKKGVYQRIKGLFIWAKVIPVSERTFRQVHKRDLALS